jgi:hypothetical protein
MRFRLLVRAALVASCLVTPRALAEEPAADRSAQLAAKLEAIEALQKEVDQLRRELGKSQPVPAAPNAVLEDAESVIRITAVVVEANLTKLRALGHEVKSEKELFELLGFQHSKGPFATIEDDEATWEKFEPLLEQKAATILSSPELITRDGQEATIAIGESAGPECALPGLHLKITPRKVGDELALEFDGTFKCRKPVPADAPPGYAKNPIALSKVQTTLGAKPGQAVVIHGGNLERATTTTENGEEKTTTEEIVPLYILTATIPNAKPAKIGAIAPAPQPPAAHVIYPHPVPLPALPPHPAHPVILSKPAPTADPVAYVRPKSVQFAIQILELNLAKLRDENIELDRDEQVFEYLGIAEDEHLFTTVSDIEAFDRHCEALFEQQTLAMLGKPQAMTIDGQTCEVQLGERIVLSELKGRDLGLMFELTPYIQEDNQIRLEAKCVNTYRTPPSPEATESEPKNPITVSEFESSFTGRAGETYILLGDRIKRTATDWKSEGKQEITEEVLPIFIFTPTIKPEIEQTAARPNVTR